MGLTKRFAAIGIVTLGLAACAAPATEQPTPEQQATAATDAAAAKRAEITAAEQVVARSTPGRIVTLELPVVLDDAGVFPKCNDSKPLDNNPLPEDERYCAAVFEIDNAEKGALKDYEEKVFEPTRIKLDADFDAAIKNGTNNSAAYRAKSEAESRMYSDKREKESKIYGAGREALAGIQKIYLGNGITVKFELRKD